MAKYKNLNKATKIILKKEVKMANGILQKDNLPFHKRIIDFYTNFILKEDNLLSITLVFIFLIIVIYLWYVLPR